LYSSTALFATNQRYLKSLTWHFKYPYPVIWSIVLPRIVAVF
jgi:hypothetical protein